MSGVNSCVTNNQCPYQVKCIASTDNCCTSSKSIYQVICDICESNRKSGPATSPGYSPPDLAQDNQIDETNQTELSSAQLRFIRDDGSKTGLKTASSFYVGTSNRSNHARALDHAQALRTRDKKNAMVKHWLSDHPEMEPKFTLHCIDSHMYNLQRQILEGLYINEATNLDSALLNSKSEWGRSTLYRLRIENSQGG